MMKDEINYYDKRITVVLTDQKVTPFAGIRESICRSFLISFIIICVPWAYTTLRVAWGFLSLVRLISLHRSCQRNFQCNNTAVVHVESVLSTTIIFEGSFGERGGSSLVKRNADQRVFVIWLERFEDMRHFPTGWWRNVVNFLLIFVSMHLICHVSLSTGSQLLWMNKNTTSFKRQIAGFSRIWKIL